VSVESARLYADLAEWWPLLSPPKHYVEEAEDLLGLLLDPAAGGARTLLELGSGGGSLAFHLKRHFSLTLTDRSPRMLAVSRDVNPEAEHIAGDMRTLALGREFDRVLIHDAIMYAVTPDEVRAAIATAARHCREGGMVVVVPDCVRETFAPGTEHGGEDDSDGRGLRYLMWTFDPDSTDDTIDSHYAFLLRDVDGAMRVEHDYHRCGCFRRADWLTWFRDAGLDVRIHSDPWRQDVFVATKRR
jgi:SAM-dependent methyltransferase